jgi:hypothetical protein
MPSAFYENVSQMTGLELKQVRLYARCREMLGVQPGRYKTFGELNKHPACRGRGEHPAPFSISVLSVKQGKRVASVLVC